MDVLVVDDERDIRATLAEFLREEGFAVGELPDARALLSTIVAEKPRLVLLDLTMPGFDPERVLAEFHARALGRQTAVVALTGLDDATVLARQLGLDGVVRKPFGLDELLAWVGRFCGRPGPRDTAPAPL